MFTRILTTATAVGMVATAASALSVTPTNDAAALVATVLAPSSGITIVGGSEAILIGAATQQGTYTDFNLSPSSGSGPSFNLPNGVVLTTGTANFPLSNTTNSFSVNSGTGAFAPLQTLAPTGGITTSQSNANALSFDFTVDDPELNSISVKFLFATDEWPTQSITDIMGISPIQYRNRLRISWAAEELMRCGKSQKAIATESGFETMSLFRVTFRKFAGMNPAEFRKKGDK